LRAFGLSVGGAACGVGHNGQEGRGYRCEDHGEAATAVDTQLCPVDETLSVGAGCLTHNGSSAAHLTVPASS